MTKHFRKELEKIKKQILTLGFMAEEQVQMAVKAVKQRYGSGPEDYSKGFRN